MVKVFVYGATDEDADWIMTKEQRAILLRALKEKRRKAAPVRAE